MSEDRVVINNNAGSSGFFGLLTIVFIVLKLLKVIDWSWVWIFSPLWMPIVIILGIIFVVGIMALVFFSVRSIFHLLKEKFSN